MVVVAVVGVLYSTVFWLNLKAEVPKDSDWKAAGQYIKSKWEKGDFVAITPYWALQGEAALRGKRKMLIQHPEKEVFPDTKRLWVVSAFGRFEDGGKQTMLKRDGVKLIDEKRFGKLNVYLFSVPDTLRIKYDFTDHIDAAEVFMLKQKVHKTSCGAMIHGKFICTANDWNWVGATHKFIGMAKRKVIWAHPVNDASLNIQYYDIPLGNKLIINTALTLFAATLPDGADVFVDIYVNGKLIGTAKQPNSAKMHHFEFDLQDAANHLGDVRFAIHSPNVGRRHFVFQAYTL